MNLAKAKAALRSIEPKALNRLFVRAYNTHVCTYLGKEWFFGSMWSCLRGYRYNFRCPRFPFGCDRSCTPTSKEQWPVFYLACDELTASLEIGARTRKELLGPDLAEPKDPHLYIWVNVTAQVLDLTRPKSRDILGISLEEIVVPTDVWQEEMKKGKLSTTHQLGRLALEDGRFGGILYPSFPARELIGLKQKICVAIFMDKGHGAMAVPDRSDTILKPMDPDGVLARLGLRL